MKKIFGIILILTFLVSACSTEKDPTKFSFSPEHPKAGSQIEIKYKPDDEKINNADEIIMVVYLYSNDLNETQNVNLAKSENGWLGKVSISDSTKGLIVKFMSEEGVDNNNELGYVIKLTDGSDDEVKGATAGLASVYTRYAVVLEFSAAKDSASKYFDDAFTKYPELKREYLSTYISSFPRSKRYDISIGPLEKLEKEENLTQKDLETLCSGFKGIQEYGKSEKYYKIISENYPKSRQVSSKFYTRFRNMIRIDRMLEVYNEFNKVNPESDLNNYMVSNIANKYASDKDYDGADKFLNENEIYSNSNVYNSIAWKLFERNTELEKASNYCATGVNLARKEIKSPTGEKPVYMSESDWKDSKRYSLAIILDTYGNIQSKLNNKKEALILFEEAVTLTEKERPDFNENYASLLFENGENAKAKILVEELIGTGKATDKMKKILEDIFTKEGGNEAKFDEYIGEFEGEAKEKLIDKLKEEIKDEVAPDFELTDLDGKSVKLSDYKGKTVILDFWATWCGPCLQSFPTMQKAVEKYEDNPNVEFLFVNTWERVEDVKVNAQDFLKKTNYPFHVLLDDKNLVVEKFKVQGIPTKFIIDGNSKIRFQSVGFSGVESEVLEELDLMIEMTK